MIFIYLFTLFFIYTAPRISVTARHHPALLPLILTGRQRSREVEVASPNWPIGFIIGDQRHIAELPDFPGDRS